MRFRYAHTPEKSPSISPTCYTTPSLPTTYNAHKSLIIIKLTTQKRILLFSGGARNNFPAHVGFGFLVSDFGFTSYRWSVVSHASGGTTGAAAGVAAVGAADGFAAGGVFDDGGFAVDEADSPDGTGGGDTAGGGGG